MKHPSRIPFHLQARCSDDKVSPLEFYLILKDEKELKASPGGWVHLTLSGILQKADAGAGKGSWPQGMEFIPGPEPRPSFSFPEG